MNLILKSKIGLSLASLAAVAAVAGPTNLIQHGKALLTGARSVVETAASDEHLLRVLALQVEDAGKTIRKGELLVRQHVDRAAALESELTGLRMTAETAKGQLAVLRPAVESKEALVVNQVRYNADEVLREANRLIVLINNARAEESTRNEALKQEQIRITATRASLEQARTQLTRLQTTTQEVELKLASARAGQETRELVKNLGDDFKNQIGGGAAHSLSVLRNRIAEMELEGTETSTTVSTPAVIQWESTPDPAGQMRALLGAAPAAVTMASSPGNLHFCSAGQ